MGERQRDSPGGEAQAGRKSTGPCRQADFINTGCELPRRKSTSNHRHSEFSDWVSSPERIKGREPRYVPHRTKRKRSGTAHPLGDQRKSGGLPLLTRWTASHAARILTKAVAGAER